MEYTNTVRNFVIENFLFGDGNMMESDDASFLEVGIIDSTGVLELVAFLEKTFNITVEDEELIPENLDSVENVVKFLERKQNGGSN